MKPAAHSIHPAVVDVLSEFLPALNAALAKVYQSGDYSYSIQVEGQIISSKNTKEDVSPVAWAPEDVEAETAKRVVKEKVAEAVPAEAAPAAVPSPAISPVPEVSPPVGG